MNPKVLTLRSIGIISMLLCILGLNIAQSAMPSQPAGAGAPGWAIHNDALYGSKISMVSETDGWIVFFSNMTAYLYRWNGTNWTDAGNIAHSQTIVRGDIAMVSANEGWIVLGEPLGQNASSVIYRWNGTSWNYFQTLTDANEISLSALDVVSAIDVWAAGGSAFGSNYYHWNGNQWQLNARVWLPLEADKDLAMVSATDGWAVGFTGKIVHWNGSNWSGVTSPVTTSLNGLSFVSANDGWAVGGSWSDPAVIVRWNGSSWSEIASPVTEPLNDISMISATNGWAVGDDGVILHWDGTSWQQAASPTLAELDAVEMISAADGWITGFGNLLRYYSPNLTINFTSGAPGSYFTVNGSGFPPNGTATISVNGQDLGNLPTDSQGDIEFILSTTGADEGVYFVKIDVNPGATTYMRLGHSEPIRPQDGTSTIFDVPAGIAITDSLYLPAVLR